MTTPSVSQLTRELNNHPIFSADVSTNGVKVLMEHHVFAVWDFMLLTKSLQHMVAPSGLPWLPSQQPEIGRLINEIVTGEETDQTPFGILSHFELYIDAMREIGADTTNVLDFIQQLKAGTPMLIALSNIPTPSRTFCHTTIAHATSTKPHVVAAALAYGRELVIPSMFTKLIDQLEINGVSAPKFKYYLERHVEVDTDSHGPAMKHVVEVLCGDDHVKVAEAETAAREAIAARIQFWNEVSQLIV